MTLGKIIQLITKRLTQKTSESAEITELSEVEQSTFVAPTRPPTTESESVESLTVDGDCLASTTMVFVKTDELRRIKENSMINFSMLQQELQTFVSGSADVQGAALVSPDGLALASVLSAGMDEERTAAMSASILSLGERIASELARGVVERIVVEGEKGYAVLVGCGSDAVLLVLANENVKQGILFLEVKRIVSRLAPLLG